LIHRLVGGHTRGDERHLVQVQLTVCLLRSDEVTEMWRVEGPAEDPYAHRRWWPRSVRRASSGADVPVALDQVLERAQLAQPDRPARVELLGRVADLGPHAELAAVSEARRRVDVDAGGVDPELEGARGARRRRDDGFGMAAAMGVDVG